MKCAETGHVTQQGAQMTDNEPYIIESYVWMTRVLFLPSFYTTKLRMYLCTDVFCVLQVFMKRVFSRYSFFFLLFVTTCAVRKFHKYYYSVLFTSPRLLLFRLPLDFSRLVSDLPDMSRLPVVVYCIVNSWCPLMLTHSRSRTLNFFLFLLVSSYFYLFENGFSFILRF